MSLSFACSVTQLTSRRHRPSKHLKNMPAAKLELGDVMASAEKLLASLRAELLARPDSALQELVKELPDDASISDAALVISFVGQ